MTTSLKDYNNELLMVLAEQKNDEAFNDLVKKIIKSRYLEIETNPFRFVQLAKVKKGLELKALAEIIIDKSIDSQFIVIPYGIDNIINSLDFDYLMIACNESNHEYIRNKAFEKVCKMFDEIEQDKEIREELMEKINNDRKVRRKNYGKY